MREENKNVFINCPFDSAYKPILDAITFVILDAGFKPRIALETSDTGTERLAKLRKIIGECRLSIHDISRVGKTGKSAIPRFNMPFECGIAYGAMFFGDSAQRSKRLLVLDSKNYRYQAALSDIAGKDIGNHQNNPCKAIECVRQFLKDKGNLTPNTPFPGAEYFSWRYRQWCNDLPDVASEFHFTAKELKSLAFWAEYAWCAAFWLRRFPKDR